MVSGRTVVENGWKDYEDAFRQFYKVRNEKDPGSLEESALLPQLVKGQEFDVVRVEVKEHYTQPPKRFTDGSLLAAMERAGSGSMADGVERRGLGTPATRADVIEKLAADGFIRREKKQLVPTEEGMQLAGILPDAVKSPELTAEWENSLALVAEGKMDADDFMGGIEEMVSGLVRCYGNAGVDAAAKELFAAKRTVLGICPKCGGQVVRGKYGAYCAEKCGMGFAGTGSRMTCFWSLPGLRDILMKKTGSSSMGSALRLKNPARQKKGNRNENQAGKDCRKEDLWEKEAGYKTGRRLFFLQPPVYVEVSRSRAASFMRRRVRQRTAFWNLTRAQGRRPGQRIRYQAPLSVTTV